MSESIATERPKRPVHLSVDQRVQRMAYRNRVLEAGVAAVKPELAVGKFMASANVLLSLPDDKISEVRSDLELTMSRLERRLASMETVR